MYGHWFLVANRRSARIFSQMEGVERFKELATFENPLGREKRGSLIRKQSAMGMKSTGRTGVVRYTAGKKYDPVEDAADQFAQQIVDYLAKAKLKNKFDTLTVAAEPHFLGKLRSAMNKKLIKTVGQWVAKDYRNAKINQLAVSLLPKREKAAKSAPLMARA